MFGTLEQRREKLKSMGYDYPLYKATKDFSDDILGLALNRKLISPDMSGSQIKEILHMIKDKIPVRAILCIVRKEYTGKTLQECRYLLRAGFPVRIVGMWLDIFKNDYKSIFAYTILNIKDENKELDDYIIEGLWKHQRISICGVTKENKKTWLANVQAVYNDLLRHKI